VSREHLNLGRAGEGQALSFLKDKGYRILARNYRSKLGEIDIIAQDKDTICFIEVKSRTSDRFGLPKEAVFIPKQKQISQAALMFLKEKNMLDKKARFDVVSIIYSEGLPKIELIPNAFELNERFIY